MDKSADPSSVELDPPPMPSWLSLPPDMAVSRTEMLQQQYSMFFERALDGIAQGKPLSQVVEEYPFPIEYARLLAWINRDENRRNRYYEAQAIGAEVIAEQMIAISDANDSLEDVARSTLRINTRKWLLGVWNRKRFGEIKQIEQNVTIDMSQAMAAAQARVDASRTLDVTDVKVIG